MKHKAMIISVLDDDQGIDGLEFVTARSSQSLETKLRNLLPEWIRDYCKNEDVDKDFIEDTIEEILTEAPFLFTGDNGRGFIQLAIIYN